MTKHGLFVGSF